MDIWSRSNLLQNASQETVRKVNFIGLFIAQSSSRLNTLYKDCTINTECCMKSSSARRYALGRLMKTSRRGRSASTPID